MKKLFLFSMLLIGSASLTSCYEFSREQKIKDYQADGKAILIKAENSKKALVEQAKAENESATLQAEAKIKIATATATAEIERAKGTAKAYDIIATSLRNNPELTRYLQIEAVKYNKNTVYVPTESGLQILAK